jgi:hypothetical protein
MKRIVFPIVAVAILFGAATTSFCQTQSGATAVIPSFFYEILDQPGCPINIRIDEKLATRSSVAPLRITNDGLTPVDAFVLLVKGRAQHDHSYVVFPEKSLIGIDFLLHVDVDVPSDLANEKKPAVSVDYVHFADGRTWGADSLGRSKDVKSYLKGYHLAISRIKEGLADKDSSDFLNYLNNLGASYSEPEPSRGNFGDFYLNGYQSVVDNLRHMYKRTNEAKALAHKLELMDH